MHARLIQMNQQRLVVFLQNSEFHMTIHRMSINRSHVSLFMKSISHHHLGDERHDFTYVFIVKTQNSDAIKRQTLSKFNKGLLELGKAMIVGLHVISIDIGDHFNHRRQIKKRRIRLISFSHNEIARP